MTTAGEVLVYDAQGKRVKAMTLPEGARVSSGDGADAHLSSPRDGKYDDSDDEDKQGEGEKDGGKGRVISLDWYDGAEGLMHPQVPTLCLALEGGTVQTSRGVDDANPIVINAHMTIRQVRRGTIRSSRRALRWGVALFFGKVFPTGEGSEPRSLTPIEPRNDSLYLFQVISPRKWVSSRKGVTIQYRGDTGLYLPAHYYS